MSNFNLKNNGSEPSLGDYIVPEYIEKKIAVDLGSNLCLFEKKYHNQFEKIFYFEASYSNYLKGTARLLSSGIKNCFGFNLASSEESGEIIKIYSHSSGDCGSNSIVDTTDTNKQDYHKVLTISLNGIMELIEEKRINYLKIDIEGGEYGLFDNFDLSRVDFIAIEIHNTFGEDKMDRLRNKILKTHEIVNQKKAIPHVRNEETCFKLRGI